MVHQGVIAMVAGNTSQLPTFENPWPAPAPTYAKGDLGWACQGQRVDACRTWLDARAAQPITHTELQMILCSVCTPKKV